EKFGANIVESRVFEDTGGARRTDAGHVQVQAQMPVFTQRAPEHHVLVAADESEVFGSYLPYHTWDPRPVAGSAGLRPTTWHPAHEAWAGMQMQSRFDRLAARPMRPEDVNVCGALRSIGEAATRANSEARGSTTSPRGSGSAPAGWLGSRTASGTPDAGRRPCSPMTASASRCRRRCSLSTRSRRSTRWAWTRPRGHAASEDDTKG